MGRRNVIVVVACVLAAAMLGVGLWRMLIEAPHDSDSVQSSPRRATVELETAELPEPPVPGEPAPLTAAPSVLDAQIRDDAGGDASATPSASDSRTFRLHVVDLLGRSVPDARIDIWDSLHAAGVSMSPAADSSGAASRDRVGVQASVPPTSADGTALVTLPSRNAALAASHEVHGDSGVWPADAFWDLPDTTVVLSLTPYGVISGRVLEQDDRPVPGAHVRFLPTRSPQWTPSHTRGISCPPPDATTDAAGEFSVRSAGWWVGEAVAESAGRSSPPTLVLPHGERVLRMPEENAIQGIVIDPRGAPVPNVRVSAAGNDSLQSEVPFATTDAAGLFRVTVSSRGVFQVTATPGEDAAGLLPARPVGVEIDAAHRTVDLVIPLIHGLVITGVVVWPDGSPVPGVKVAATRPIGPHAGFDMMRMIGGWRFDPPTDAQGRFRIGGLHPAMTYDLETRRDDRVLSRPLLDVRPGTLDVVITAESPVGDIKLVGQVIDATTGLPAGTFDLVVREAGGPSGTNILRPSIRSNHVTESEGGRFVVGGLDRWQQVQVEVDAPGKPRVIAGPFELTEAETHVRIELGTEGALTVRVRGPDGEPVRDARVQLLPESLPAGRYFGTPSVPSEPTGIDGTATLSPTAPGTYRIQAVHPVLGVTAPERIEIRPFSRERVEIAFGGVTSTCDVTVYATGSTGEPIPDASVSARLVGRPSLVYEGRTNVTGQVTLTGIEPGLLIVSAMDAYRLALHSTDNVLVLMGGESGQVHYRGW